MLELHDVDIDDIKVGDEVLTFTPPRGSSIKGPWIVSTVNDEAVNQSVGGRESVLLFKHNIDGWKCTLRRESIVERVICMKCNKSFHPLLSPASGVRHDCK